MAIAQQHLDFKEALKKQDFFAFGASKTLVVFFHGYQSGPQYLYHLARTVHEQMPDADMLLPSFRAKLLSNSRLLNVRDQIFLQRVDRAVEERKARGDEYQEIIFVGHSVGGLIARKLYVAAMGRGEPARGQQLAPAKREWAGLVRRLVMLAGMNRGWSLRDDSGRPERPEHMSRRRYYWYRFLEWVGRRVGFGRMILDAERGAPFVSDLRIQWVDLARDPDHRLPVAIQIRGDHDDMVTAQDHVDLLCGHGFVYRNVPGTAHYDLISFREPTARKQKKLRKKGLDPTAWVQREREFIYALMTPLGQLKNKVVPPVALPPGRKSGADPVEPVTDVLILMHGIRDYGNWTNEAYQMAAAKRPKGLVCDASSYGFFSMIGFLLSLDRQRNVRWFMDLYTEEYARHPDAAFHFIGHSNGTYLVGSALERYTGSRFDQVVLAGSVLPRRFNWDRYKATNRVTNVRNYMANWDWVVALGPKVFDIFGWRDIGSGGFDNFTATLTKGANAVLLRGNHSAGVQQQEPAARGKIFDNMLTFIFDNRAEPVPNHLTAEQSPSWLRSLSALCWVVWAALIAFLVLSTLWILVTMGWPLTVIYLIVLRLILRTI